MNNNFKIISSIILKNILMQWIDSYLLEINTAIRIVLQQNCILS